MAASAGAPAAPSSRAGLLAELGELLGRAAGGFGVAASRRAAATSARQSSADVERALADELLGRRAAPVAGDVARRHGDEVGRDAELVRACGDAGRAEQVDLDRRRRAASRTTTVAAEWMTMSTVASVARSASSRPRPSVPTSPAMMVMRRSVISSNDSPRIGAELGAQPVEGVVLEQLALRRARPPRCACRRRTSRTSSQSGTQRSSRSTSAVPDEPGRAGDGDALAGERFCDHNVHLSTIW